MSEISYRREEKCYRLNDGFIHHDPIFNRIASLPRNYASDGATSARDLGAKEVGWRKYWAIIVGWFMQSPGKKTSAWFVHDWLCDVGEWDDGTKISNFTCSTVLACILFKDGYYKESVTWWFATFLGGGGVARDNGMFFVKR